jgi:hypothetical protein
MTDQIERIILAVIPAIGAVISAICVAKVNKMHTLVNSRMTELLDITRKDARSEGELARQDFIDSKKLKKDSEK